MSKNKYCLSPGKLSLKDLERSLTSELEIERPAWKAIQESSHLVEKIANSNRTVYGINTGFGLLAHTKIDFKELKDLQRRILLSHAAGIGEHLPERIVKLALLLRINTLIQGYSGIRPIVIERLVQFYNHGIYPVIPSKGSVGASGDLAPLAHLALPLIGEGHVTHKGRILTGREANALIGAAPIQLAAKEGLSLINGTQVSTAMALNYAPEGHELLKAAVLIGALSVDAAAGSTAPFHPKIQKIRGHQGQIKVGKRLMDLLKGSKIPRGGRVQDPYSLRCQPQVLGASLDSLKIVLSTLMIEANGVSDNPLVFVEEDLVVSGGNFHAEPVAQMADLAAIALSVVGGLSERRIALLVDPNFNGGLPAFLVPNPGINSGFMMAHVSAAALASANKSLAHPYSVDNIPTSANQEDYVSMSAGAAWRLREITRNVRDILAIELLAACQGIELRRPAKSSPHLEKVISLLRKEVPFWGEDRFFAPDIEKANLLLAQLSTNEESLIE